MYNTCIFLLPLLQKKFLKYYHKFPSVVVTAFLLLPVNTQIILYPLKHEIGLHCSLFRLIISRKRLMPFRIRRIHQIKDSYSLSLIKSWCLAYTMFITLIYFNHINTLFFLLMSFHSANKRFTSGKALYFKLLWQLWEFANSPSELAGN